MENFIEIITQPDNIAILIMLAATVTCTLMAFREMRANDKLIKKGEKEKVYERMVRL